MTLNGSHPPRRTVLVRVGWYAPDAPEGQRLVEDRGWQPPYTKPVYVEVER